MKLKTKFIVGLTVFGLVVVGAVAVTAFLYSGLYDIAAKYSHLALEQKLITTLKRRSVVTRADELVPPPLEDAALVQRGLVLYRDNCIPCHGAPGVSRARMGIGMNPNPPPLERAAVEWRPAEIYWITANGLKMAGMPAFDLGEEKRDLWALTAFVLRMNTLSPDEYQRLVAAVEGRLPAGEEVDWLPPEQGWEQLRARGDAGRGREHLRVFGCGACHVIPGLEGAEGRVGPPLSAWKQRHYIVGSLVNNPRELVRWVVNPPAIEPTTAMPALGVTEAQAWDIAAYLYTLGED